MGRRIRGGQLRHTRIRRSDVMPGRLRRLRRHTQPIPGEQMNIHHHDETTKVIHGDCIKTMNAMPPEAVDGIVADRPYRVGFMGKKWDDLPPSLECAEACYRVLKPGGHIAAFGGTRTWHRLAVAIEDAGFEMRDSLAWLYGCLSEDTEVLINGEWVQYHRAKAGDLALCYNKEHDTYEW